MCLLLKKEREILDRHLTRNKKTHFGTNKETEVYYKYLYVYSLGWVTWQPARGDDGGKRKRMLVGQVHLILRNHHSGREGYSPYHAGVFLMLRPGLASHMHTIYARKKSFFQPIKGSELLIPLVGFELQKPQVDQGKRGFNCLMQSSCCIFYMTRLVENNGYILSGNTYNKVCYTRASKDSAIIAKRVI